MCLGLAEPLQRRPERLAPGHSLCECANLMPSHPRPDRGVARRDRLHAGATREAMLAGVRASSAIIVGAYVDGEGGVCPMLAAHRRGGRTDFLSFARAWDRFTRSRSPAAAGAVASWACYRSARGEPARGSRAGARRARSSSTAICSSRRRAREADPPGERIRVRRLLPRRLRHDAASAAASRDAAFAAASYNAAPIAARYSASPGRMNMISGTTQAGEVLSR